MTATADLAEAAAAGLRTLGRRPGVIEVEVFVAANTSLSTRLCYTSHLPCNGVEEPKSVESLGVGIRAVLAGPGGPVVGFGSEAGDVGPAGMEQAFERARRTAVADPGFTTLPRPGPDRPTLRDYHDPRVAALDDESLVRSGWTVVHGALRTFLTDPRLLDLAGTPDGLRDLGLVVGGDVSILHERMAVASTAMPAVQADESTLVSAFVTALVEAHDARGSGWATGTRLDDLTDEAGAEAARRAIDAIGSVRVPSGRYTVVLGPQPVTDLLDNLVLPGCTAAAFHAETSPFTGRLGQRVVSPLLSIVDDATRPGDMASKGLTCEGLPTTPTDLIRDGVLVGLLGDWYQSERLLADRRLRDKLGADGPVAARALRARNGFRFGTIGGRHFDRRPGTAATNVVVEARETVTPEALLARVGEGLYIGRIWYTYPVNGLRAGDFTCTVTADSFVIRGGRRGPAIRPNTLRLDDNVLRLLDRVLGVTTRATPTIVWAGDEVVLAPEIAVTDVPVREIAGFMEGLTS